MRAPAAQAQVARCRHACDVHVGYSTSAAGAPLCAAAAATLGAWAARHRALAARRWRRHRPSRAQLRAQLYRDAETHAEQQEEEEDNSEVEAMMSELRGLGASRGQALGSDADVPAEEDAQADSSEGAGEGVDISSIERSGRICVMGVPNSGKSSLVNALVGAKVSIVSPKAQTTRQKVLGLALLAPRPDVPPNTQAVFVDTAGIMQLGGLGEDQGGPHRKNKGKKLFKMSKLHKAMVKTAWKATRDVEHIWWVLDAGKCYLYGEFMPPQAELDGVAIGPPVKDHWWLHPEMNEELDFLRRLRKNKRPVQVVLNKMDLLRDEGVDLDQFTVTMRDRLLKDLGNDLDGQPLLQSLWPTSVLHDEESLIPLKVWLCENLPRQSPIYPVEAVSDVPARVAASEITREKLFGVLREEVPYHTAVVNAVWRETEDGTLLLGQKVVVRTEGQMRIVRSILRDITEEAEQEISETINFGRPVRLHFQVMVDDKWMEKEAYYADLQGLLQQSGSLMYPH